MSGEALRDAYDLAVAGGFGGSRREFAALVLRVPSLFRRGLAADAQVWWVETDASHRGRNPLRLVTGGRR